MNARVLTLDPLTGDIFTVVCPITHDGDKCVDGSGREVVLDNRGNWRYVEIR